MNPILIIALCLQFMFMADAAKLTAQLTYFESYSRCCINNPNYNPQLNDCSNSTAW